MARKLAVLLCTTLLLGAAPSSATAPAVFAGAEQIAIADWLVFESRDSANIYFAAGRRFVDPVDGIRTVAIVGKGRCRIEREPGFVLIICTAHGRAKEIPLRDFEMDPALETAKVKVRSQGFKHKATWTGRGEPGAYEFVQTSTEGAYAEAWVSRWARAEGKLFGHRFRGRGPWSIADMGYGAFGGVFVFGRGHRLEIGPDDHYTLHATYKLAR